MKLFFGTSNFGHVVTVIFFLFKLPMKMEQSVPKFWHRKFRHWGITQKKEYIPVILVFHTFVFYWKIILENV